MPKNTMIAMLALLLTPGLANALTPPDVTAIEENVLGETTAAATTLRLEVSCRYTQTGGNYDEGCAATEWLSQSINTGIAQGVLSLYEDDGLFDDAVDISGACSKNVSFDYVNEKFSLNGVTWYTEGTIVSTSGGGVGGSCPTAGSIHFTIRFV